VLNARQFGLKLIANVTYGYTAAGFSGRMPLAELADSIVQARARAPPRAPLPRQPTDARLCVACRHPRRMLACSRAREVRASHARLALWLPRG